MILPTCSNYNPPSKGLEKHWNNNCIKNNSRNLSRISFGDDGGPSSYDWKSSLEKFIENKKVFNGETEEAIFLNMYKEIENDLTTTSIIENQRKLEDDSAGIFQTTFAPKQKYVVSKEIPINQENFVRASAKFIKEYGLNPQFRDTNTAIKNFVINNLGILPSKNFIERWFCATDYSVTERTLYYLNDFLKNGLIVLRNKK